MERKRPDISQIVCGYTTDMQNIRPSEGGRIWALPESSSVYFVLELIKLKAFAQRNSFLSSETILSGDQAEVTGEQGHEILLDMVVPHQ